MAVFCKNPAISILLFINSGCKKKNISDQKTSYSFFVAGHTYGTPGTEEIGLYSEFKNKFPLINSYPAMKLGILTGDIVKSPSTESWNAVDQDIETLGIPAFFAVGNHDMYDRDLFEDRYGETYFDTIINNDLFIILDPNLDHWNISGEQLNFLEESIITNATNINNIFVFFP